MATTRIILANFGNEILALLQYAIEQKLAALSLVSIDTHWAAARWQAHVQRVQAYARACGIDVVRLSAKQGFAELVRQRRSFPSKKFQWCASLLKGVVINAYLDEIDPSAQVHILLAKRREAARLHHYLQPSGQTSEYYGGRIVDYPLYKYDILERNALIKRAGFDLMPQRSLECDPCIHSCMHDYQHMEQADIEKTLALERQVGQVMFPEHQTSDMAQCVKRAKAQPSRQQAERFTMGCGSPWGCGE